MKYIFCIISLSFLSSMHAQNANLLWAKNIGGTDFVGVRSMWVDASGNVYTIGYVVGTADFDPGPGVYNLISAGSNDVFVSKLDASGNFVWAKNMGGVSVDFGRGIVLDATDNLYISGVFQGTADFDPGPGVYNLTSAGSDDIFISKLDASGNLVWAKSMGGSSNFDWGLSISVDASGNVYTTGQFQGTADFDPGPGVYNLISAGSTDIFISKLDVSGNFVWATRIGDVSGDFGLFISVDASDNIYTTGAFTGTADFDPGPGVYNLTSAGGQDIFICKIDALGNLIWAKNMGGGGASDSDWGESIVVDATGNVYITGRFGGTGDFDPGPGIYNLTSAGGNDIFVSKLDASGNFAWAKNMGGASNDLQSSISVDAFGNVYTTGEFLGTGDFDPGPGVYNLTSAGGFDIFISKLDGSGNFVWAKNIGGASNDEGRSIIVDSIGNLYITGNFSSATVDFDPGPGIYNLTRISAVSTDMFIMKFSQSISNGGSSITTVAGNGTSGYSGDGGPATSAQISPKGPLYVDASNNIFFSDNTHRVRKVDGYTGIISTIAGTGTAGYTGDGGPATSAQLSSPFGIYEDVTGNVYVATLGDHRIRKINTSGIITTIAGTGTAGYSGDGGLATLAKIDQVQGITGDIAGNIYFADFVRSVVRKINTSNIISTIAGTGTFGYSGNGGLATAAQLSSPNSVSFDAAGNYYIGDDGASNNVRKVNTSNIISTIAGSGNTATGSSGDGGPATSALFCDIECAITDSAGNIYIADACNNKVRKVDATTGRITTIAGTGIAGYTGDGGPANSATLHNPWGLSIANGDLYISDITNKVIRTISNILNITTWTGAVSTAWEDAGNWSSGVVPDTTSTIFINSGATLVINSNVIIRMLSLSSGATITVNTGFDLRVTN